VKFTTNRKHVTKLGVSATVDEMSSMYLLISPPMCDFSNCYHLDQKGLQGPEAEAEAETGCMVKCGSHSYPTFSLPRDNTKWPWSDANARKVLGDAYPVLAPRYARDNIVVVNILLCASMVILMIQCNNG
jgi:hypothetical protein